MQRPLIEDILDVLREVQVARSKDASSTAHQLRRVALQSVASREMNRGRFANQASADHSIQDACSRRLGVKIADFERALGRLILGDPMPLQTMLDGVPKDVRQREAVAQIVARLQGAAKNDLASPATANASKPRFHAMRNAPTTADYVRALTALGDRVTDEHRALFRVHHAAADHAATARQLAAWARIEGGWRTVNARYGKLGHALCDVLGIEPELRPDNTPRWWTVWSQGWRAEEGFVWQMLPNFASALERLGWVDSETAFALPEEVTPAIVEGARVRVELNGYERSPEARRRCIEAHGLNCCVCGMNFGDVYGAEAEGYIHVHHLRPLAEIGGEYVVDPIVDLRPVCPNCHAVLHRRTPAYGIEEVRAMLLRRGGR